MTQITDPISAVALYVAYSTDGTTYTDISGVANKVTADAQTRMSGVTYTFDGDTGLVTFGKREPFSIRVSLVYSETSTAYTSLLALHEAAGGSAVYIRWTPAGNTIGNFQFDTPATKISEWNFPSGDATTGDPILVEFVVGPVPSVTKSTVTT